MSKFSIVRAESKLTRKLGDFSELFVGIDVHKRSYAVAFFSYEHKIVLEQIAMPADVQALVRLLSGVREKLTLCVYEAGSSGFSLARALSQNNIPVRVVSPRSIPRPGSQDTKTDGIDAMLLAEYAATGLLRYAGVPTRQQDEERQLLRQRKAACKERSRVKIRIKMFLHYNGIDDPEGLENWRRDAVKELRTMPLTELLRFELDMLLDALKFTESQLARYMSKMRHLAKDTGYAEVSARLCKIPGVGILTSMIMLVEMPDPQRFATAEQVARYAGLSPRLKQSGETTRSLGLTFSGNRHIRHVLIEAAWRWVFGDACARRRYDHLKGRTGCAQKAITAMARKLAIIMWKMRIDGTEYNPTAPNGNGTLSQTSAAIPESSP